MGVSGIVRDRLQAIRRRALGVPGVVAAGLADLGRRPTCRQRTWVVAATLLVSGYAAWVMLYVLTTPELGFRCAFTPVVNHFHEEGFLFPRNQEPLREGDRIVQVGDQPIENWSQLLRKTLQLPRETPVPVEGLTRDDLAPGWVPGKHSFVRVDGQSVVRVEYQRGDEAKRRVVWCRLGPAPLETLVPSVLWFLLKVGLFVVGAVVFWKRPEDRSARQFFWLCILSFGAYMGGYHWHRIVTQPILILVFMVCSVFLPAATLHFYLIFPRPKPFLDRLRGWVMLAVYGPPVLFFLLLFSGYLRIRWIDQGGFGSALPGLDGGFAPEGASKGVQLVLLELLAEIYCYFAVAFLCYLASLASLIHSYRYAGSATVRNQIKWILLGAMAAALPLGYTLSLAFREPGRLGGGGATWPMFMASAFVTVAYTISITRYRLMQLDQIVSSGAVYFLISSLAGLLYYALVCAGMVLMGNRVIEGPSFGQVLGVSLTALVLMVALDLIRGRLKQALDRHFRREKIQLDRTLQRMSQAIDQLVDPPTLARRLLHTATDLLGARTGAVYLRQGEPSLYRLTEALGPTPTLTELPPGCPLVEGLQECPTIGPHPLEGNGTGSPLVRQLHFLHGEVAVGLMNEGQLLGFLVLGPRERERYAREDLQLLAAFSQVTVLALVSAEGHRLIERLNLELKEKVEKIAEQQRRIVALQSQLVAQRRAEEAPAVERNGEPAAPSVPAPLPAAPPVVPPDGVVGSSAQMQHLLGMVRRVAASSSAVLLRGETGTGKELLARALHENSPRAGKPYVKVVCATLSPWLLESELFGHVKGAFTTAIRDKVGRFETANGGTLFLDEIGDVSLEVQTKLLRVLEEMTFERVGSSEPVHIDVRIVAATHQDLEALIRQGKFRQDLFFRLNVLPIHLPPLRLRVEDIPELVQHFLRVYSARCGKEVTDVDDDAMTVLKAYSWPGNIRELEHTIQRAVVIGERSVITQADLPADLQAAVPQADPRTAVMVGESGWRGDDEVEIAFSTLPEVASAFQAARGERDRREREQLVRALAAANGNKAEAARALGMARSTFISRLKKLGLG
jgi:transcriptional regulator with GAF, ATPase, and Fis domain